MVTDVIFLIVSIAVTLGVSLNFIAVSLLIVAGGLTWATIWFWVSARPEPQSLAPLEIMGEREFADADENKRKQMLNSVRAVPVIDRPVETSSKPETN